jgi:hypothetical protein
LVNDAVATIEKFGPFDKLVPQTHQQDLREAA